MGKGAKKETMSTSKKSEIHNRVAYIVDVFAEEKYGGNQLAVVRDRGESISDQEMQKIAREFNFSEMTFILSDNEEEEKKGGGYDVRIFTPKEELPFAGHPTLGTAYVIQKEILKRKVEMVVLNLKVGQIPVSFTYKPGNEMDPDLLWMKQAEPKFNESERISKNVMSGVLSLDVEKSFDDRFPIQEVSTGLPTTIIPLKNLDVVKKAKINREKYFEFLEDHAGKSILVFAPDTYHKGNQLNVRVFAEYFGVPEDPATGSGNGCLAAYLVKHRYFGKNRIENLRVEQGYEVGRHSLLFLTSHEDDNTGKIQVHVGGRVQSVLKGELIM